MEGFSHSHRELRWLVTPSLWQKWVREQGHPALVRLLVVVGGLWLSHGLGATAGSPPRARASLVVCFEACFQWRAPSYVSGLVYLMVAVESVIQHLCLRMLFAFLVYHSLVPILEGPAQV